MNSNLFDVYEVELELIEPMLGTVPANRDVHSEYIKDRASKRVDAPGEGPIDQADEIVPDEGLGSKGYTTFYTDKEGHPILMDYQIKGFIKESGNIMKDLVPTGQAAGFKALRSHIDNELFVFPRRIKLADKVDPEPLERPLRAQTMQGPRVTVVKSDTVPEGTSFKFQIKVLKSSKITEDVIRFVLDYGEVKGLGQWRNGSYGRFMYRMAAV